MGVIEQARALAAELGRSQELQTLKLAERQVMDNQNAFNMLNKYMEMENSLMLKQMQGQVPETEIRSLNSYREQISQDQVVARFFAAKQNFDKLWYQVNQILSSVLQT